MLYAVVGQGISTGIFHALLVEPVPNPRHSRAFVILFESVQNIRCRDRVDLEMLFRVNHIPHRQRPAVKHTFQRIVGHAAHDFFGEVNRIVFGKAFQHRFQNDTLRTV